MARPLKSLPLFFREIEGAPRSQSHLRPARPQLWISVSLSNLALESLDASSKDEPVAVTEQDTDQIRIVAVNKTAHALGVRRGLKLSAAVALSASLQLLERSPEAERRCLESLATWAGRLTPLVSVEPPESLLLEVAGSLRLFGSFAAIKHALELEISERRLSFRVSAAPTPLASLWLARHGAADVLDLERLPGRLGPLPLWVTCWPKETQILLHEMGIRTVGDCIRLPRDGFARRVGKDFLEDLDRALGKRFDIRPKFEAAERWSSKIDFLEETSDLPVCIEAVDELLDRLMAKLRKQQRQIQELGLCFEHRRREPTVEHFDLVEPTNDKDRLLHLISDRLERLILVAPVVAVVLRTGVLQSLSLRPPTLFASASTNASSSALIERLRERFGAEGVHGVGLVAEHRPEHAWSRVVDDLIDSSSLAAGITPWPSDRPLWILPIPLPLSSSAARRYYTGTLRLQSEPERIESGWWDGHDVRRDYYIAAGDRGEKLWIYRDRLSGEWHLHGIFG